MKNLYQNETLTTHPSEILADELEARGISIDVFAKLMEMDLKETTDLFDKKVKFDKNISSKIEKILNIPARIFLNLQIQYDDKINELKNLEMV